MNSRASEAHSAGFSRSRRCPDSGMKSYSIASTSSALKCRQIGCWQRRITTDDFRRLPARGQINQRGIAPDVLHDLRLILGWTSKLVATPIGRASERGPSHQLDDSGHHTREHLRTAEIARIRFPALEPAHASARHGRVPLGDDVERDVIKHRFMNWRIKQQSSCQAVHSVRRRYRLGVQTGQERQNGRERMIQPYRRPAPAETMDGCNDAILIAHQSRNRMHRARLRGIPPVVPEVVDKQVEVIHQQRPERIVEVDRQPNSVTHDDPGSIWITMSTHGGYGMVIKPDPVHRARLRELPYLLHVHHAICGSPPYGSPPVRLRWRDPLPKEPSHLR